MKEQVTRNIEKRLSPLKKRIEQVEQQQNVVGVDAISQYCKEVDNVAHEIGALAILATQAGSAFSRTVQKKLQSLITRLALLPSVPRIEVITLAQSILALNPVILVIDDIVDEEQQPQITRIFLMEPTKVSCFDYQFPPSTYEGTGSWAMDEEMTSNGDDPLLASLKQEWTHLQNVLHGRYVIAFHLPLAQDQLAMTAQMYGLAVPMVIGHSLLDLLLKYVRVKSVNEKLDQAALMFSDLQLCEVLAKEDVEPFLDLTLAPADQRALHLLQALEAIASGTLSLQEPLPIESLLPFTELFLEDEI